MNLEELWKSEGTGGAPPLTPISAGINPTTMLQTLRKRLVSSMIWTAVFCLGYAAVLFFFPFWQVRAVLGAIILYGIWAIWATARLWSSLGSQGLESQPVLTSMKGQLAAVKRWMYIQERTALVLYPMAVSAGFLTGGVVGADKPIEVIMAKPVMWYALAGCIVLLTPVCYYLARWMMEYAFGTEVKRLEAAIGGLE